MIRKKAKKLTIDQVAYFENRVLHWQVYFGLIGWKYCFKHFVDHYTLARVSVDHCARAIEVGVNLLFPHYERPTKYNIDRSAFHETMEILLSGIEHSLKSKNDTLDETVHGIIRTLENSIFRKIRS